MVASRGGREGTRGGRERRKGEGMRIGGGWKGENKAQACGILAMRHFPHWFPSAWRPLKRA